MTGDTLIELYRDIHGARTDYNTAVSEGSKTRKLKAQAALTGLQSRAKFYLKETEAQPYELLDN